jgi:hypothetical protein
MPPVPEGDYREYVSAYSDLALRVWLDGVVEVFDDVGTVDRWEGVSALPPSPVPEEPEGKVLVDRDALEPVVAGLEGALSRFGFAPSGDTNLARLRAALDESPAPVESEGRVGDAAVRELDDDCSRMESGIDVGPY